METIDLDDYKDAFANLAPSGDHYIVRYCSVWNANDDCIGTRIIASIGPIYYKDLDTDLPVPEFFDAVDALVARSEWEFADADYLQAAEDEGKLTYPFGAR